LREQNQALNQRLSAMLNFGSQNDKTQGLMIAWLKNLLLAKSTTEVRQMITSGLGEIFGIESVELIAGKGLPNYCGPIESCDVLIKDHLGADVQSLAVVNLPTGEEQLLLASTSKEKFTSDMGRFYLEQIAELADSAIHREQG
jgi:uncharacterized protein YigA (DUF484 family)